MAIVRMFAAARAAAGRSRDELPGATVGDVLEAARSSYGPTFAEVLESCRIWVNGEPAVATTEVSPDDEIAILPPVSGGAG
jgi:molybdopterin converting factor small subunit